MINFFSKKLNKKGFTLAELLIVIAIIAILVAIAVPIFTNQLNKAKISRDKANVRSARAQAIMYILDDRSGVDLADGEWSFTVVFAEDGNPKTLTMDTSVKDDTANAAAEKGSIKYDGKTSYTLGIESQEVLRVPTDD